MKKWLEGHPKAALMSRKRADILRAARAQFLDTGYNGTSMESIAKAANVSIMTLYRHAQTKDALFAAVIGEACHTAEPDGDGTLEQLLSLPLPDVLLRLALHMQDMLTGPGTVALMRVVIGEVVRFPHLAELAYEGFIVGCEEFTVLVLAQLPETATLNISDRRILGRVFVDRIIGTPMLRALLGRSTADPTEIKRRADLARNDVLATLSSLERTTPGN